MSLVPYNKNTSRFSSNKNWSKILFNPDRKLQTTEFIEIQDLLENQVKKLSKNLYDFYNIVEGCKVLLINIEKEDNGLRRYNYLVTNGKAFIELDAVSTYIDIPSLNFSIDNTQDIVYIGITFKVELLKDDSSTKDIFSGGEAFGYLGADRLVITPSLKAYYSVTEDGGFYPVAIIKPRLQQDLINNPTESEGPPDVFYYRNSDLSNQYKDSFLPIQVEAKLQEVLHEISGDFISEGLSISYILSRDSNKYSRGLILKVDPGVVYINGKRLEFNYVTVKEYEYSNDIFNSIIFCYITRDGVIEIVSLSEEESNLFSMPEGSLELGFLLIKEDGSIKVITNRYLMPETSDLIKLNEQHKKNKQDLLDLSIKIDELNQTLANNSLTGILSDSFSSLKNSNTSHPLFNVSIAPSIQGVTLPFTSVNKNKDTFVITNEQDLTLGTQNEELYWSSVSSTDQIVSRNQSETRSINVGVDQIQSGNLEIRPNILYLEDNSALISPVRKSISDKAGSNTINTTVPNTRKVRVVSLLIRATGFTSLEDNIELKIDNLKINSVILYKGTTPGTITGSYKANEAGHVTIKTEVEINTLSDTVFVFLESNTTSASNQIKLRSLNQERSLLNSNSISSCIPRSSSVKSGIASTFTIQDHFTLKGVQVILKDFNNSISLNRSILDVYLTKTNFGIPTDEVLAVGSLILDSGIPVLNSFVSIEFEKPAILSSGEYALIFTTTYENLRLASSVTGENINSLGVAGSYTVNNDKLFTYNKTQWEELNEVLTLNLIKSVPFNITNTTSIKVEDIEAFNAIELDLPLELSSSSTANITIDNRPVNNRVLFFDNPIKSTVININTIGTPTSHPILELDNININLLSYKTNGSWISINREFARAYNFVEISFDIFNPPNSSFEVYFSSNQGQTWESLTDKNLDAEYIYLEEFTEVNKSLPLYRYKFRKEDLSFTKLNNEVVERSQLMVRIDLSVTSLENIPFFKNLIAITY